MHATLPLEIEQSGEKEHWKLVRDIWTKIDHLRQSKVVTIDGESLDIASVVAVSRYGVLSEIEQSGTCAARVRASVDVLDNHLADGRTIYGVTTGFGGSADTRTQATQDLQSALLQHLHIGILTKHDRGYVCNDNEDFVSHAMPRSLIKGTILVRCNTISRGHSAVSMKVIETVQALLVKGITPIVPLRGSVSASGDLSPLSYVAGAVTGNPDIMVQVTNGSRSLVLPANQALGMVGLSPVVLGPKEGLGLLNGTATSAAAGSLAMFDSHNLVVLSQILTSMSVEALLGSYGSFHPFLAQIRPHQGQTEVAKNIRSLLKGSHFVRGLNLDDTRDIGLFQDRYPLRTSSQWLGPQLEDLLLAHKQISAELNSTTDNPLIDIDENCIHHGGNFQATSVTSAMEKARLALQMVGRLLFAQCSEIINPMLSNGLPPNLSADEPSISFTCKGIDTSMAAYMSELAYLANPVSSHVQSAEMHNQAVNSLALISARYTLQSAEIVTLMAAAHLYVLCQALDLRAMLAKFFLKLEAEIEKLTAHVWNESFDATEQKDLDRLLWQHIVAAWSSNAKLDSPDRAAHVAESSLSVFMTFLISSNQHGMQLSGELCEQLAIWKNEVQTRILDLYTTIRSDFFDLQDTIDYLGRGSRTMYRFIRHQLGVPFNQGLIEHPHPDAAVLKGREKKNIGSWISIIHDSIRDGRLYQAVIDLNGSDEVAEPTLVPLKVAKVIDVNQDAYSGKHINSEPRRRRLSDVMTVTASCRDV
ncbi:MAG: hypothetical protein Q9190_000656 [Brigantiaea leucoxantha]